MEILHQMNNFIYGMWCMWFIMCVIARGNMSLMIFVITALIIPGLLVMMGQGLWFVIRLVKFRWEKRNG